MGTGENGWQIAERVTEYGIAVTNFRWNYGSSRNCCFCSLEDIESSSACDLWIYYVLYIYYTGMRLGIGF